MFRRDVCDIDDATRLEMTHVVVAHFNVFGLGRTNWIVDDGDCSLIVNFDQSWLNERLACDRCEKCAQPDSFFRCFASGDVLSLDG